MSLRDRLRKMDARDGRGVPPRRASPAAAPAESGSTSPRSRMAPESFPIAVPVATTESRRDAVVVRELRYDLNVHHGRHQLGEIRAVAPRRMALAARHDADLDPRDAVFLDTETSDLAGGASVYVFMVGLLFVEEDHVVVQQILLDGPEGEDAFLDRVAAAVGRRTHLVTFSGKSFDRHRLDDRFALLRGERPFVERPHLDLCHLGRRLYRGRLRDTRLRTFEEQLLGVRRVDDLGGAECPEAWFDYLEGFDDGRMERVFEHNLIDVLSLLTLTVCLDRALHSPRDAVEAARAGLLFEDAGDERSALAMYHRACEELGRRRYRVDKDHRKATLRFARLHRKAGATADAMAILDRLADALPDDPEPPLIASRIAERDLKDKPLALRYAYEHRMRLSSRGGGAKRADLLVAAARRIQRLGG